MKGVSDVNLFRESNSAIIDAANIQMILFRYHTWQIVGDNEVLNGFYFLCLVRVFFLSILHSIFADIYFFN